MALPKLKSVLCKLNCLYTLSKIVFTLMKLPNMIELIIDGPKSPSSISGSAA